MIRVERGPAPPWVKDPEFRAARDSYAQFRLEGGSRTKQTTMHLETALGPYLSLAAEYAYQLFHGKCAYTEVPAEKRLHLHRPESDALDEPRPISPNHYWWTAAWYRNWYTASYEVEALKRSNFPVLGERAPEPRSGQLRGGNVPRRFLDRGVLLDPCEDYPELHLDFHADGTVTPWGRQSAPWLDEQERERGAETIRLLDLNSPTLVRSRKNAIRVALDLAFSEGGIESVLGPEAVHLGAMRQAVAAHLLTRGDDTLTNIHLNVLPELAPRLASDPERIGSVLAQRVRDALQRSGSPLAELLEPPRTVAMPPGPIKASARPRRGLTARDTTTIPRDAAITRLLITNFQAIEKYELKIPAAAEGPAPLDTPASQAAAQFVAQAPAETTGPSKRPWRVFLGENGSGKSSVLRAIALALATTQLESLREECNLAWTDLLRRGATESRVLLEFTGGGKIDLRITAAGARFVGGAPQMDGYVRGFGATRLTSDEDLTAEANVRLGNLFDPRQPVVDAEKWLLHLERHARGDFNVTAVTIARLLGRGDQVVEQGDEATTRYIRRAGAEITIGGEPLRTISDGYRAVVSLACDLMAGAGTGLSDIRNASGIVLVDELGSYLHPRWKMQITGTLREEFPSMQFLVTTHEPLCLRKLLEREVVRVRPSAPDEEGQWRSEFETLEESPSRFRVDQLLTSSFFGLDTTIDPDVEKEFAKYYALIRKPVLTTAEEIAREELRASLSTQGILGYTARDQLVYDAIDRFLATAQRGDPKTRRRDREEVLNNVADIWRNVAARREFGRQP